MLDVAATGTANMRMTTKLIAEQALARAWKVEQYYAEGSQLRVTRADGKVLELYSASSPIVSYIAVSRSDDKYFATMYLANQHIPVPETYLVRAEEKETALGIARTFFEAGKQCVVKPLDAGHGDGITVAVAGKAQMEAALLAAKQFSPKAIIQEYFPSPVDIRVTCIDYRFVAALVRIPARVQGDGQHNLAELIDITNQSGQRGQGYVSQMNVIPKAAASVFLGDAIHSVPAKGEWVSVVGTANVGTGGETQDVTAEVPDWLKRLAEQTARSMSLSVCGVDFLLATWPTIASTQEQLKPVVIELNQCPSLFIHEVPVHGQSQPVVAAFLDYLATI